MIDSFAKVEVGVVVTACLLVLTTGLTQRAASPEAGGSTQFEAVQYLDWAGEYLVLERSAVIPSSLCSG